MFGMGALLYVLDLWCLSFWRTVNTPVGVAWPFLPVEQVDTPIRTPLR